ncbi:MAG: hydroxyacid dehydrogenase [Hamadaea sp.]|nr:hydroxyacid dehydrogenase [Hamadaea sp.]NUT20531.1 hydroxyacid dehydrogenase [Hamadaea sp.]
MSPKVAPGVLPEDLLDRLARSLRLPQTDPVERFDDQTLASLAPVEVLLTSWSCPRIDARVLDAAPRLRAVVHAAGSVKAHVDPEVFTRGVLVSSAADANADPVADFTVAVITLAGKRGFRHAKAYAAGKVPSFDERRGNDGRVIGVIGASRIGRRVITRLIAAGYRVLISDPYLDVVDAAGLGAELTELDELCQACDVVTVHAPQLPSTRHLLDERRLALLPDGAILINTARGSLVDTDALARECANGRIDACLDVTDPEPLPPGHPLFQLDNVWITPHMAGVQGREVRRLGEYAVAEVERLLAGEPLLGRVYADQLALLA